MTTLTKRRGRRGTRPATRMRSEVGVPRGEAGSVTVVAAGLTFLACMLCLVTVDVGRAVGARGLAQTAADAAALAAAQAIAIPSGEEPSEAATRLAEANGATLRTCDCARGSSEATVVVALTEPFVLLGPDRTVTASARAVIGPP
jgi:secretion/DNA translocation related TadE-like protein